MSVADDGENNVECGGTINHNSIHMCVFHVIQDILSTIQVDI